MSAHNHEPILETSASMAESHNSHNHHNGHNDEQHQMSMHAMAFHFGSTETILFNFWSVSSPIGIIVSFITIILGCFVLETVRGYRLHRKKEQFSSENESLNNALLRPNVVNLVSDGSLHAIQLALSYMLMLVFMTFNVWLCIAVVLGEVLARTLLVVLFPKLERLSISLSATETCCG